MNQPPGIQSLSHVEVDQLSKILLNYIKKNHPSIHLFCAKKSGLKVTTAGEWQFENEFWNITVSNFFKFGISGFEKEVENIKIISKTSTNTGLNPQQG